jgi:hypothetical protein
MVSKIRSVVTILWIGLFAGTLDITDNLIFNQLRGITPKMVFQYIASGLIGMQAFRGGLPSVALVVALPYAIALIWEGRVLCGKPQACDSKPAACSNMNFIILPLSGVPHPRSAVTIASRVNGVLALLLFIGLPISLLVRRYSNERRR